MTPTQQHTTLALQTIPLPIDSTIDPVVAIIRLTPNRAQELLSLMKELAILGSVASHVFKISSFEPRAIYVPARTLKCQPADDDFVILPSDFAVSATSQVKIIHADVFPLSVSWLAFDLNNRFTLTSTEVDRRVLHAIASGTSIFPGATKETFTSLPDRSRIPAYLNLSKYSDAIR